MKSGGGRGQGKKKTSPLRAFVRWFDGSMVHEKKRTVTSGVTEWHEGKWKRDGERERQERERVISHMEWGKEMGGLTGHEILLRYEM